jgi:hypothetical protein
MISGREQPARITLPAWFQCRVGRLSAQQSVRKLDRETPLADSRRTYEQIRAGQPAGRKRPPEPFYNLIMSNNSTPHIVKPHGCRPNRNWKRLISFQKWPIA